MSQEFFRVTGHLQDAADLIAKKFGFGTRSKLYKLALRLVCLAPDLAKDLIALEDEHANVQAIVDEMILRQAKKHSLGDLAIKAWIEAATTESRARNSKMPERYFIIIGDRKLGPHHVDLLRRWVALDIIPETSDVIPEKGSSPLKLSTVYGFFDYPEELEERILEHRRNQLKIEPEKPTKRQQVKLDFFQAAGLESPAKGLYRARVSEVLDTFAILDPETEHRYQLEKKRGAL